jgi:hypothetical protein
VDKKFNNQFATQKLRQETSATNFGGATFTPGTGEQMATNKAFKKKTKKEVKDVEPKLAAGKAKIYMKDKWGWKDAPSVPNRPSKGGFIYKQLFEELNDFVKENQLNINNEAIDKIHIGTDTKTDSDIYFEPSTGTFSINVIDAAGNRTNKLQVNTIDDVLAKFPNWKWTSKGKAEFSDTLNEGYTQFKNETKTRSKPDQFHQAIREVKKKVQQINKMYEYVSRLKTELSEGEDGLKYKMHTEKALNKIKEMVSVLKVKK